MPKLQNAGFEARLILAQAATTPAEVLTELAIIDPDSQIRRAVALNPNTPTDILLLLGKEFPDEVMENPIFHLLLLEDLDNQFVRLSLAHDKNALIELSRTKKQEIHYAIARAPKTPISVLEKLAEMYRINSEISVAQPFEPNRYLSPTYKGYCILSVIVQNPNVSELLLYKIAGFGNEKANALILQKPNTSTSIIEEIASVTSYPVYSDAFLDDINPQAIRDHPNGSETAIALMKARRGMCGIPSAILERLVNHPNPHVRFGMLTHPELSLELLIKLAEDAESGLANRKSYFPTVAIKRIVELIFQNLLSPNHPVTFENKVLFWIARHHNTQIVLLKDLALNQPDHVYERLGEDQFKCLRVEVANNHFTPSSVLRRLSLDPEAEVRNAAQTALRMRKSTG